MPALNLDADSGAAVAEVTPGGPGAAAGLQPGDVITKIDGKAVSGNEDIGAVVDARKPGDKLRVQVDRGGDQATVTITLTQRPATAVGS